MVEEHCRAGSAARDEGCPNIGLCSTGCTYRYDLWSALAPSQRRKERGSNPHENPRALPIGSRNTAPFLVRWTAAGGEDGACWSS